MQSPGTRRSGVRGEERGAGKKVGATAPEARDAAATVTERQMQQPQ